MRLFLMITVVLAGLLFPSLSHAQVAVGPMNRVVRPDTPANHRLLTAIEAGDLPGVQAALQSGASADAEAGWEVPAGLTPPDFTPVTVLATQSTSRKKALPIFRLLIQNASAASVADPKLAGLLLYAAVEMDDLDSLQRLAARGIDLNPYSPTEAGILNTAISQSGTTVKTLSPMTQFLLDHGAQVNAADTEGMTPLMNAAQYDKSEVVRALLAHGADPALRDKRGWTALNWAALRGWDDVVAVLQNCSPMDLNEAAEFGDVARVRAHLDAGEDPNALKTPIFLGRSGHSYSPKAPGTTPLMDAMKSGSLETARLLLDRGANINEKREDGMTALHYAARYGDAPLTDLLLDRGADINAVAGKVGHPATPLMFAVAQARADVVTLLLRRGADIKHGQGEAALESAVRDAGNSLIRRSPGVSRSRTLYGEVVLDARQQIIDSLLAAGVDIRAKNSHVLYLAANEGQAGLVKLFLDKSADVNGRGAVGPAGSLDNGATVLMGAINAWSDAYLSEKLLKDGTESGSDLTDIHQSEQDAKASVMLLLAHNADVNLPDAYGTTPLMQCVSDGLPTLAALLLAHGAKVDAANPAGQTALMQAAGAGSYRLAALLLAHRANVNKQDKQGRTALMLAVDDGSNDAYRLSYADAEASAGSPSGYQGPSLQKNLPNPDGHPDTVRLLLQHGASVNAVALDGTTALSHARKENFAPIVALLLAAGARR